MIFTTVLMFIFFLISIRTYLIYKDIAQRVYDIDM